MAQPLLILAGESDIVTKPEASEVIAGATVSPLLHIISEANHMSFLDHAPEYHHLLENYISAAWRRA